MNHLDFYLKTILANSELPEGDKQRMADVCSGMNVHDKANLVALLKDDGSKLETAVDFLKDVQKGGGRVTKNHIERHLQDCQT